MSESKPESPKFKMSSGAKSLTQFLVVIGTAVPAIMWVAARPYAGPDGDGTNFLMGFAMFLFWFPMLFVSFCYGLIAIVDNNGRTKGIIVLSSIALIILWGVLDSMLRHS